MKRKIKDVLQSRVDAREAYRYYFTIAFCIYLVFPLINFIRRISGGEYYFSLWRDYLLYVFIVFIVFRLFLRPKTRSAITFSGLKRLFFQNPAYFFLALLSFWMLISAYVTGLDYGTVIGTEKSHTGLLCSLIYVLVFVTALQMNQEKHIRLWIGLFLTVGLIVSALIVFDYFIGGSKRAFATQDMIFYNSNHLSYYLLVVTVCAYVLFLLTENRALRLALIPVFSFGTAALLLANTLGCHVALAASFAFTPIVLCLTGKFRWKRFSLVLLAVLLVFLILWFVPNADHETAKGLFLENASDIDEIAEAADDLENAPDSLGSGRMILWRTAIQATLEKPIFGNGLSAMRNILLEATDNGNNTVHNEFLEYASNQGIPALLFYLAFIFSVFIRGAKNRKALTDRNIASLCTAFAYLVSSMFGVTMFYTAPYLFLFLAFGYYKKTA